MARIRLTRDAVKTAKPAAKRREIPDATLPGFYLIVQPSGAKSFAIRYRGLDGKHRKYTIGPYPRLEPAEAREKARQAFQALERGDDPVLVKRTKNTAETVGEAYEEFLERYAKRNRSWRETDRIFRREVLPGWSHRKLADLRKRDVIALLDAITERAPTMGNRTLAAVRRFLNWCVERDLLETSPATGVRALAPESRRDRLLTPDELKTLWYALEVEPWPFQQWGQLLILTAQRRAEVAEARWSEFDQKHGLWTIAADRAKNGLEHVVPLGPMAQEIIKSLPVIHGSPLVFPATFTRKDDGEPRSFSGFSKLKTRLNDRMVEMLEVETIPHWTFHDLRRTAASTMAGLGIPPHVVEKLLNHTSGTFGGIVGVYQRFEYRDEKADALRRWEAWLQQLLGDAENVVALHR